MFLIVCCGLMVNIYRGSVIQIGAATVSSRVTEVGLSCSGQGLGMFWFEDTLQASFMVAAGGLLAFKWVVRFCSACN